MNRSLSNNQRLSRQNASAQGKDLISDPLFFFSSWNPTNVIRQKTPSSSSTGYQFPDPSVPNRRFFPEILCHPTYRHVSHQSTRITHHGMAATLYHCPAVGLIQTPLKRCSDVLQSHSTCDGRTGSPCGRCQTLTRWIFSPAG